MGTYTFLSLRPAGTKTGIKIEIIKAQIKKWKHKHFPRKPAKIDFLILPTSTVSPVFIQYHLFNAIQREIN